MVLIISTLALTGFHVTLYLTLTEYPSVIQYKTSAIITRIIADCQSILSSTHLTK